MSKSQFVLIAVLTAIAVGLVGCSHVAEDWKAAQTADTTQAYQDFVRQHPDSEYGVPAQERLKQLAEDRDWQQAQKTDTLDAYQQFVATHADGKWAQEARVRIENFQLNTKGQTPAAIGAAAGAAVTEQPPAMDKPTPIVAPVKHHPSANATRTGALAGARDGAHTAAHHSTNAAAHNTHHHGHVAQLGAYSSKASAESAWRTLSGRFPTQLKSVHPSYVVASRTQGKSMVRLRISLASTQSLQELCAALKKKAQACVPAG